MLVVDRAIGLEQSARSGGRFTEQTTRRPRRPKQEAGKDSAAIYLLVGLQPSRCRNVSLTGLLSETGSIETECKGTHLAEGPPGADLLVPVVVVRPWAA